MFVTFTEGAYTNQGPPVSGALVASDFVLNDVSGNGAKTIFAVSHTEGSLSAVLTLNNYLEPEDAVSCLEFFAEMCENTHF